MRAVSSKFTENLAGTPGDRGGAEKVELMDVSWPSTQTTKTLLISTVHKSFRFVWP